MTPEERDRKADELAAAALEADRQRVADAARASTAVELRRQERARRRREWQRGDRVKGATFTRWRV